MLSPIHLDHPPFDAARSVMELTRNSGRLITLYKDNNQRGLSEVFATLLVPLISPDWLSGNPCITFIPSSPGARLRRGFDQSALLAHALARQLDLPVSDMFRSPHSLDQRALTREERFHNMSEAICLRADAVIQDTFLIVDDVYTTGSTLFAASMALRRAGAAKIYCATLARA